MDRNFITQRELLERIPYNRRTLFTWRKNGMIPFMSPGGPRGRILYDWPAVRDALERMTKDTK